MTSEVGDIELAIPRDRAGSFTPMLVGKGQRRLDGVDGLEASRRSGFVKQATALVADEVYPAWREAIALLESQLPQAADDAGVDPAGGALPRTGDDSSIPLAKVGIALAAIGGVATAVAAKRRKAAALAA